MSDKNKIQGRILQAHIFKKGVGFTGEVNTYVVPENASEVSKDTFDARLKKRSEEA